MLNPTGTPSLAQGGTGDVLAGFLGGLLAHPPHGEDALCRNVAYTVYRHGLAAEKLDEKMRQRFHEGESSLGARWTAEDLIREL